jgi:hypothetical protein
MGKPEGQSMMAYFLRMFLLAYLPTILLAFIASRFLPEFAPSYSLADDHSLSLFWRFVGAAVIVPFIETAILIYPTVVARTAPSSIAIAAFVGALPIALLHGLSSVVRPFIVFWFFFVQAYAFLTLRNDHVPFGRSYMFAFLIHGLSNFVSEMMFVAG